ncbi:hypothetical protein OV079_32080 [Nannocystis pusilla]|uniref:Uncharacterized protein n=1 Tax=Nannocystis pusilla TaxID=889268 RepID=A0A9X3EU81_9BACT|nr:hypothetical protein [Nannocystis pusilla]MCY1010126.1 hypothetical protein [Nannocystis pusilla]
MRSPQQPRSRDRARHRRVAVVLGGVLGLLPARAPAMPTIGWEAPAGCPSAERVVARIGEVVGERPVSPAVTSVRARVERQGGGWLLVVVFSGRDGSTERRLTLHDCEATANATALLVGIALVGPASVAAPEEMPLAVPVPEPDARDGGTTSRDRGGAAGPGGRGGGAGSPRSGGEARGRAADGAEARGRAADGAGAEREARGRAAGQEGAGRDARRRSKMGAGARRGRTGRRARARTRPRRPAQAGPEPTRTGRRAWSERTQEGARPEHPPIGPVEAPQRRRGRGTTGPGGDRAFLQVGPALAVGVLPRATLGLAAGLGVAWRRLRVALGYAGWFRSPARWAEDRQIGADVALHAGSLRVGPVRRVGPVELQAAIGLEFGALRAAGVGSEVNLERRTWWGATLVGGGLAWAPRALRGRGALRVQAELVVPLHRPTLLYNREPIFRFGALGLRAGLLLEARFF